jgi:hypothetical protein
VFAKVILTNLTNFIGIPNSSFFSHIHKFHIKICFKFF